ncbi:MAG: hypothetical protein ABIN67_15140 [Ferruginibacter sp.]
MKYYFVNYLVFDNKEIVEKKWIGVPLHHFANTNDFKLMISRQKDSVKSPEAIIIERYKQVTKEEFYHKTPISD